jgi:hypothetical protein
MYVIKQRRHREKDSFFFCSTCTNWPVSGLKANFEVLGSFGSFGSSKEIFIYLPFWICFFNFVDTCPVFGTGGVAPMLENSSSSDALSELPSSELNSVSLSGCSLLLPDFRLFGVGDDEGWRLVRLLEGPADGQRLLRFLGDPAGGVVDR